MEPVLKGFFSQPTEVKSDLEEKIALCCIMHVVPPPMNTLPPVVSCHLLKSLWLYMND